MCLPCTKRRPSYLSKFYFTVLSRVKKKKFFDKEKENTFNFAVRTYWKKTKQWK